MKQLREITIHQSLTRPLLLMGGERELVLVNAISIAALVLGVGFHWLSFSLALFLATCGHWALVEIAKRDPQMRHVLIRHLSYQEHYPAQASIHAPPPRVMPSVKR
jgi:type IV secretion system protein VirB3